MVIPIRNRSNGDLIFWSIHYYICSPLITINSGISVRDAVALMEQKDIRTLPIVDDKGQMVDIITAKDIFKAFMKMFKESVKDQDLMSDGFDLLGLIGVE